jgi:predicted nucleotidyltransferase
MRQDHPRTQGAAPAVRLNEPAGFEGSWRSFHFRKSFNHPSAFWNSKGCSIRIMNFKVTLKNLLGRFSEAGVEVALSGGLALSTMGVFRFTKDIDFLVLEEWVEIVDRIMVELGYEKQGFSTEEIVSYTSPLKVFGQVDFLVARRKYSKAMLKRAREMSVLDGAVTVKALLPEDLIGLKLQAIVNDPINRYGVDAPDIQRLLKLRGGSMDMNLVREYFRLFEKEDLLDEWLEGLD